VGDHALNAAIGGVSARRLDRTSVKAVVSNEAFPQRFRSLAGNAGFWFLSTSVKPRVFGDFRTPYSNSRGAKSVATFVDRIVATRRIVQ
jgi:hypothetical protein